MTVNHSMEEAGGSPTVLCSHPTVAQRWHALDLRQALSIQLTFIFIFLEFISINWKEQFSLTGLPVLQTV